MVDGNSTVKVQEVDTNSSAPDTGGGCQRDAAKQDPKEPVASAQARAWLSVFQNGELLAQDCVFNHGVNARFQQ
jgi:hypothetical protein